MRTTQLSDDTDIENMPNNVRQLTLNLVPPQSGDKELRECLDKGLAILQEEMKASNVQSFIAIILNETESPLLIGAGDHLPLKTIGALRVAEDEILKGL